MVATYVIGDIHGRFSTLEKLLESSGYRPESDRVWLVGDLVGRGPRSAQVLRWARNRGPSLTAVLGNHDLKLLARILLVGREPDLLSEEADGPELTAWLRTRPLFHREGNVAMVHAGVPAAWSWDETAQRALEAERALQGEGAGPLLQHYLEVPLRGTEALNSPVERLSCTLQMLTRMRTCSPGGGRCPGFSGPPEEAPPGCVPWFELTRQWDQVRVYFGHWSRLGFFENDRVVCLDDGCTHGGKLTAVRLENSQVFQQDCLGDEARQEEPRGL